MPSRPLENTSQDWTPVVFSKSTSQARAANAEHQRNMPKQTRRTNKYQNDLTLLKLKK